MQRARGSERSCSSSHAPDPNRRALSRRMPSRAGGLRTVWYSHPPRHRLALGRHHTRHVTTQSGTHTRRRRRSALPPRSTLPTCGLLRVPASREADWMRP
eukprot:3310174-Prymnesium_polylepis.1